MAFDVLAGVHHGVDVVDTARAHEDTGLGAPQGHGVDSGALQGLPGGLQQDALLGVHRHGLAGRDAEEARVERGGVDEAAFGGGTAATAVAGEQVEVPAAVRGEGRDAVPAVLQQLPEFFRRPHATR